MPANKFSSIYLNGAYQRMLAAVQDAEPPSFGMFPTSSDFENAAEFCKGKMVSAIDDFFHALAIEADSNARSHISTRDKPTLLSSALHDSGLVGDLEAEAYALQEEREFA